MNAPALAHRYQATRAALEGFLRRRAPSHRVEELASEVWLRVVRADPVCADEVQFRAFVFTVARRLLVDEHRRRLRHPQEVALDHAAPATDFGPDAYLRADRVLAVVESTLDAMKPEVADVFRLRTQTALSFKEIALRQGVSLNTALGRMHQATKSVARALRDAGLVGGSDVLS